MNVVTLIEVYIKIRFPIRVIRVTRDCKKGYGELFL